MKIWFQLKFLCLGCSLLAGESNDLFNAHVYYEADEYKQASDQLNKLLTEDISTHEKAVLNYNLGTISLAEKNWDEARLFFEEARRLAPTDLLLNFRTDFNMTLALFREGLDSKDNQKSIYLLREALKGIPKAAKSYCALTKMEGWNNCTITNELKELHQQIKFTLGEQLKHEKIPTDEESISFLVSSILNTLNQLTFLKESKMEDSLRKKYIDFFIDENKTWLKLWEKNSQTSQAKNLYIQALDEMKEGKLEESQKNLNASLQLLNEMLQNMWGKNSEAQQIQDLLKIYVRALGQEPLQNTSLQVLIETQNKIQNNLVQNEHFKKANEYLKFSNESLQKGQTHLSRIYLTAAQQNLSIILQEINEKDAPQTPKTILSHLIKIQENALNLNRLSQGSEEKSTELQNLIFQSQQTTNQQANNFLTEVLAVQKRDFPQSCQEYPWKDVLPLFEKGYSSAFEALNVISQNLSFDAIIRQENSISAWKKALIALENYVNQTKESVQSYEYEKRYDNILQQLQEMEIEDKSKPIETSIPKPVARPW